MSEELVVLHSNVVIEPLVARWHAWSHLISPATFAMNIPFRHLTLLESFVTSPDIHAAACKTPSMRGGPFVDLPASAVPAIKELIQETKLKRAQQIAFGEGLRNAYRQILKQADGFSLEPLYPTLPEAVRGYVELCYSLGGHPDLRVIEPLLYRSPLYDNSTQSAMIYRASGDDRSFAFSTPRLPNAQSIELHRPFSDEIYDYLARLRNEPRPAAEVLEKLELSGSQAELMRSFLTPASTSATKPLPHTGTTRWRYFGHACVLVEAADGSNMLVDPVIAYEAGNGIKRFTLSDLPEHIDYVVLTHNHADHVLLETLLALRYKVGTILVPAGGGGIADPSLKLMLEAVGFKNVVELHPMGSVKNGEMQITALPFMGEHGDLDVRSKAAWFVETASSRLLFAADSNNIEPKLYDILRSILGPIDTLFIGMECAGAPVSWTYGPLFPIALDRKKDQTRRLDGSDFARASKAIESMGCKEVFIYAMGAEPWLQFVTAIDTSPTTAPMVNSEQLIAACKGQGMTSERLYGHADVTMA